MIRSGLVNTKNGYTKGYRSNYDSLARYEHVISPHVSAPDFSLDYTTVTNPLNDSNTLKRPSDTFYNAVFKKQATDPVRQVADILLRRLTQNVPGRILTPSVPGIQPPMMGGGPGAGGPPGGGGGGGFGAGPAQGPAPGPDRETMAAAAEDRLDTAVQSGYTGVGELFAPETLAAVGTPVSADSFFSATSGVVESADIEDPNVALGIMEDQERFMQDVEIVQEAVEYPQTPISQKLKKDIGRLLREITNDTERLFEGRNMDPKKRASNIATLQDKRNEVVDRLNRVISSDAKHPESVRTAATELMLKNDLISRRVEEAIKANKNAQEYFSGIQQNSAPQEVPPGPSIVSPMDHGPGERPEDYESTASPLTPGAKQKLADFFNSFAKPTPVFKSGADKRTAEQRKNDAEAAAAEATRIENERRDRIMKKKGKTPQRRSGGYTAPRPEPKPPAPKTNYFWEEYAKKTPKPNFMNEEPKKKKNTFKPPSPSSGSEFVPSPEGPIPEEEKYKPRAQPKKPKMRRNQ